MERVAFDFSNKNYFSFLFGIFFRFITDGHLAVVVFFVLSGYALSVNNLCFKTRNLALAAISRYFRLMIPIFITSAIAYLLLRYGLFFNLEAAVTPIGASSWLGGFYNFDASFKGFVVFSLYDVFFKYNPELTYNSVLWTMSVEMFGSLFVYAYLGIFRAKETVHWKLIFIILVTSFFYKTLYACFAAGYLIAEFNNKNAENGALFSSKLAQRGLIALAVVASVVSTFYHESDRVAFFVATIIVFCASYSLKLESFFSNRVSAFLGRISFPLYLIQIPIICSWSSYLFIKLPLLGLGVVESNFINLFSTVAICLLVSWILLPVERISVVYSKKIGRLFLGERVKVVSRVSF